MAPGRLAFISTGEGPDDEPEGNQGGCQPNDRGPDPPPTLPSAGALHGQIESAVGRGIEGPDGAVEEIP
jgi:hypothetical protein